MPQRNIFLCILLLGLSKLAAQDYSSSFDKGEAAYKIGDFVAAIAAYQEALAYAKGDKKVQQITLSECYHKIANSYYQIGEYEEALSFENQSLAIREPFYKEAHPDLARSLGTKAAALRELMILGETEATLYKAVDVLKVLLNGKTEDVKNTNRLASRYQELARLYKLKGDYATAQVFWNRATDLFRAVDNKMGIAQQLALKGLILFDQRKFEESRTFLNQAIELGDYVSPLTVVECYSNIGFSFMEEGNYQAAVEPITFSVNLFEELFQAYPSFLVLQQGLASSYNNLAFTYGMLGEKSIAQSYFEKGLDNAQIGWKSKVHPKLVEFYEYQAIIANKEGNYDQALDLMDLAFQCFAIENAPNSPAQSNLIGDQKSYLKCLRIKAEALTQKAKNTSGSIPLMKQSLETYLQLDSIITILGQGFQTKDSWYLLLKESITAYESAIQIALQLCEKEETIDYCELAYHFSSKNKALVLMEELQELKAQKFARIPDDLLERERTLKQRAFELNLLAKNQWVLKKDSLFRLTQAKLFEVWEDLKELRELFEKEYPSYYELKYAFPEVVSIKELQQQLPDNTLMLEYFVGNSNLFIFSIGKNSFHYTKLALPENFLTYCKNYRQLTSNDLAFEPSQFQQLRFQLYQWLVAAPLEKHPEEISRLILIPDDVLLHLSFDALLTNSSELKAYLIKDYAISYAYSNKLLFAKNTARQKRLKSFGGFGIEYDDYTLKSLEQMNQETGEANRSSWGKLEFSDDEVMEIARLLEGNVWVNELALKSVFMESAADYNVLHLAMHGLVNEENPLGSALIFTRTRDSIDNFLWASDVYGLPLNANLAVLSACNTGYGTLKKGEGIRSLARAFSYAGCGSQVASLWPASDQSSKTLLVDFYKNLKAKMPKDIALQQAKLSFLKETSSTYQRPAFWAHFIVLGDLEPITENSSLWYLLLFGLLGSCLIGWFFLRKKNA